MGIKLGEIWLFNNEFIGEYDYYYIFKINSGACTLILADTFALINDHYKITLFTDKEELTSKHWTKIDPQDFIINNLKSK